MTNDQFSVIFCLPKTSKEAPRRDSFFLLAIVVANGLLNCMIRNKPAHDAAAAAEIELLDELQPKGAALDF